MQYLAFYGVFSLVLYGMHLYVYFRLNSMLAFSHPKTMFLLFTLLAFSFPAFSLLEKFSPGMLSMLLYAGASTWLGVVFLLFSALIIYEPLRLFITVNSRTAGFAILLTAGLLSAYGLVNAFFIDIKSVEIPVPNLGQPLRIVQLSDIHVGTIHNSGYLSRIVEKTNALQPDMVMITGDLFDGIGPVTAHTVEPLKKLQAKAFFVIGNHERYDGLAKVSGVLEATGVVLLRNQVVEYKGIQIAGVDFPEREGAKDNPVVRTLPIDRSKPSLLLFHAPFGLEDAAGAGINVQLSGHTHNGQIFPFSLLAKIFYPRVCGLYRIDSMSLYVSPGTGTWGPPMRLGSRSEITLISLVQG